MQDNKDFILCKLCENASNNENSNVYGRTGGYNTRI